MTKVETAIDYAGAIDRDIKLLITMLNAAGVRTMGCCSAYGLNGNSPSKPHIDSCSKDWGWFSFTTGMELVKELADGLEIEVTHVAFRSVDFLSYEARVEFQRRLWYRLEELMDEAGVRRLQESVLEYQSRVGETEKGNVWC